MVLPDNFIENNFKYFIRFCKENEFYSSLKAKLKEKGFINADGLIARERNEISNYGSGRNHDITLADRVSIPIIGGYFNDTTYTYWSLVRMLNLVFIGDSYYSDTKSYTEYHNKLFSFVCRLKPKLKNYNKLARKPTALAVE